MDDYRKGNPGSARGWGVLRDHAKHMIMSFRAYFDFFSNNLVEALALKIALR